MDFNRFCQFNVEEVHEVPMCLRFLILNRKYTIKTFQMSRDIISYMYYVFNGPFQVYLA